MLNQKFLIKWFKGLDHHPSRRSFKRVILYKAHSLPGKSMKLLDQYQHQPLSIWSISWEWWLYFNNKKNDFKCPNIEYYKVVQQSYPKFSNVYIILLLSEWWSEHFFVKMTLASLRLGRGYMITTCFYSRQLNLFNQ